MAGNGARQGRRGRVAVVTGGGGGIGSETALELARQGAVVVVMDPGVGVQGEPLGEPSAARTVERIEKEGGPALAATTSVTDLDAVRSLFSEVVARFGSLDIVVNTAGILRFPQIADASEDDWSAVLDVHLNGYLNILNASLPRMAEAGYGRVVGFTSGVGLARTSVNGSAYGSAKRAVASLTWQLGPVAPPGVMASRSPVAAMTLSAASRVCSQSSQPRGRAAISER